MLLKQSPKDFIVDEVLKREFKPGKYGIYLLKKTNYNTESAVTEIANQLKINRKRISYAGLKDKIAITTQHISILNPPKNFSFSHPNISLKFLGTSTGPISLGDLEGNKFKITVREIKNKPVIDKTKQIPNYFDNQRFSTHNHIIGKHLLKREFQQAVNLILQTDKSKINQINKILQKNPNDFVNALRTIPPKMLMFYIHAYQSQLFNETVYNYLKTTQNPTQTQIPLIGFGLKAEDDLKHVIDQILKKENLAPRDFIIREIPELSMEGALRDLFIEIKDLNYEIKNDTKTSTHIVILEFYLPKGCYATMVVKNLIGGSSGI